MSADNVRSEVGGESRQTDSEPGGREEAGHVPEGAVRRVPIARKLAFGLGHVQNDMCSAMWFTYLLLFLQSVLRMSSGAAGVVLLVGQVADGLATVFVGVCSHWAGCAGPCRALCLRYGPLKAWHLLGTVCIVCSFPFIFMPYPGGDHGQGQGQELESLLYFCGLVVVFQFGWAVVQISHLSMIPEMSSCELQRTSLTSFRYGATILSSVFVYCITWAWIGLFSDGGDPEDGGPGSRFLSNLALVNDSNPEKVSLMHRLRRGVQDDDEWDDHQVQGVAAGLDWRNESEGTNGSVEALEMWAMKSIGPKDKDAFRNVALVSVGVGLVASILFHATMPSRGSSRSSGGEPRSTTTAFDNVDDGFGGDNNSRDGLLVEPAGSGLGSRIRRWLTEPQFYQVAAIYTSTRLYVNVSQAYMTFFVQDTLGLQAYWVAIIPLVMFSSGFVMAFTTKAVSRRVGLKWTFLLSSGLALAGCLWALLGCTDEGSILVEVVFVALLYGAGGSALVISSLSITSDLIRDDLSSSALVYGSMSFFDKVFNGVVIAVVQHFVPPQHSPPCDACKQYYKDIVAWFCGAVVLAGILGIATLARTTVGSTRARRRRLEEAQASSASETRATTPDPLVTPQGNDIVDPVRRLSDGD